MCWGCVHGGNTSGAQVLLLVLGSGIPPGRIRGTICGEQGLNLEATSRKSSVNISEPSFFLGIFQQYLKMFIVIYSLVSNKEQVKVKRK